MEEVNRAIDDYLGKWQAFVGQRKNKEFFERLKPTAIGWKVADLAEYDRLLNEWRDACDHIAIIKMNERWIAKLHLKDTKLNGDIEIIKLMQRRPDSNDATGLDHLDFLDMEETNTKAILAEETDIKWDDEQNGIAAWTSIRFEGTEAKLRPNTVIDVIVAELEEINNGIRGDKFRTMGSQPVSISDVE
jgi:hypothetical protein